MITPRRRRHAMLVPHVLTMLAVAACGGGGADAGGGSVTAPPPASGALTLSTGRATVTVGAGASGTVPITVGRSGSFAGSVSLSVEGAPTGVAVSLSPATLDGGATESTLSVSVAAGTTPGTASLTVRGRGAGVGDAAATVALTIPAPPPVTVALSASSLSLVAGMAQQLTATVTGSTNGAVTWSSGAPGVAAVSSTGRVTAASAGTATITARAVADTTRSATATVTVTPAPPLTGTLLASGAPASGLSGPDGGRAYYRIAVPPGATQLQVRTTAGTGDLDLYLRSALPADTARADCAAAADGSAEVCTVSSPAPGEWSILLHGFDAYAGVTLTATVSTTPAPGFAVTTSVPSVSVAQGGSVSVPVTLERSGGFADPVTLSVSTGAGGVTASATLVTIPAGASASTITLTASATAALRSRGLWITGTAGSDRRSIVVPFQVVAGVPVTVSVAPSSVTLRVGQTQPLTATVTGTTSTSVAWSSSSGSVASVDPFTGVVTAHAAGTATITATSYFDPLKKATATVTVTDGGTGSGGTGTGGTGTGGTGTGGTGTGGAGTGGAVRYVCTSGTTPAAWSGSGIQCVSFQGAYAAVKYDLPNVAGHWVDEVAGLCIRWGLGAGKEHLATGRYKNGGLAGPPRTTAEGRWGALVNSSGQLTPSATQFYVFTSILDDQTKLVGYSNGVVVGGGTFRKASACPW